MIVYDFPITSKDIVKGSKLYVLALLLPSPPLALPLTVTYHSTHRYNDYIAALDALMTSLELTGAVLVLESLFPVLNEANHQHAEAIANSLTRYIQRVSDEHAREAFDICFR